MDACTLKCSKKLKLKSGVVDRKVDLKRAAAVGATTPSKRRRKDKDEDEDIRAILLEELQREHVRTLALRPARMATLRRLDALLEQRRALGRIRQTFEERLERERGWREQAVRLAYQQDACIRRLNAEMLELKRREWERSDSTRVGGAYFAVC